MPTPELSVVVATRAAHQTLRECLRRLARQAEGRNVEIIVVDGSAGTDVEKEVGHSCGVRHVKTDPRWLVPRLWGVGIDMAEAPIVALTIGQCLPAERWIDTIVQVAAERQTSAGFGGGIDGPHGGRWRDWALYFSRYSAYMPPVDDTSTLELAADNAAYRMSALEGRAFGRSGFWENLVHHDLRARGWRLSLVPDMRVQLGPGVSAWTFCRERYLHGRYFGSTRPGRSLPTRFARVLTAPALAPFLVLRIGSRIARHRSDWLGTYVMALPWMFCFLSCWSVGEAVGYMTAGPERP